MLAKTAAAMTMTAKIGGTTYRVFTSNLPTAVILGMRFLWRVLSMKRLNSTSKPGIRVNTASILNKMALISTTARSRPMPKCINPSAARPLMVVSEEEEISGIALESAAMQASRVFSVSCSSLKRWHRMMA